MTDQEFQQEAEKYLARVAAWVDRLDDEDEEIDAADATWDPVVLTEQMLQRERIAAAWVRLHQQHRVVLSLHEIEGYSLDEVATIIAAPLGTAKSRLHRARKHLRALLSEGTNSLTPTCNPT